jgi:hypothetical protein
MLTLFLMLTTRHPESVEGVLSDMSPVAVDIVSARYAVLFICAVRPRALASTLVPCFCWQRRRWDDLDGDGSGGSEKAAVCGACAAPLQADEVSYGSDAVETDDERAARGIVRSKQDVAYVFKMLYRCVDPDVVMATISERKALAAERAFQAISRRLGASAAALAVPKP